MPPSSKAPLVEESHPPSRHSDLRSRHGGLPSVLVGLGGEYLVEEIKWYDDSTMTLIATNEESDIVLSVFW